MNTEMINELIEELRALKKKMSICFESEIESRTKDISTLNKAIIACEQLRKARKKAKRWKRKYLNLEANYDEDVLEAVEYNNKMWKAVQKGEPDE